MDEAQGDDWLALNEQFRRRLYDASGMPRLRALIGSLWVAAEPYLRPYVDADYDVRLAQEQHREILEHVCNQDAAKAAAVLRKHLERTLEIRRAGLELEQAEGPDADRSGRVKLPALLAGDRTGGRTQQLGPAGLTTRPASTAPR